MQSELKAVPMKYLRKKTTVKFENVEVITPLKTTLSNGA
jgi:hypothetical protein